MRQLLFIMQLSFTQAKNASLHSGSGSMPLPTFDRVQALQRLRVGVDEVEVVLQPRHLALVPRRPQLAQPGDLVHELLLLADPKRTTAEISIRGSSKLVYI